MRAPVSCFPVKFWIGTLAFLLGVTVSPARADSRRLFFEGLAHAKLEIVVDLVLKRAVTGLERDSEGRTALYVLFIYEDFLDIDSRLEERIAIARFLLSRVPSLANALNTRTGENPLFAAIHSLRDELIRLLLIAKTNPNQRMTSPPYWTPREYAISHAEFLSPVIPSFFGFKQQDQDFYKAGIEANELLKQLFQDDGIPGGLMGYVRDSALQDQDEGASQASRLAMDQGNAAKAFSDRLLSAGDYSSASNLSAAQQHRNSVIRHFKVAKSYPSVGEQHRHCMREHLALRTHHQAIVGRYLPGPKK